MMIKQRLGLALALCVPLATLPVTVSLAQTTPLPPQEQEHILVSAESKDTGTETLSGINLSPTRSGTYQLDFSQELEEDAMLEIKNTAGKLVYQKPIRVEGNRRAWRYQLGKLKPDTYLIQVKTSDTTYWTKFRVGR